MEKTEEEDEKVLDQRVKKTIVLIAATSVVSQYDLALQRSKDSKKIIEK